MKDRLESTVTTLQEFYTVIVGVAFVGGVEKIVMSVQSARNVQEWMPVALLGVAFLSTVIPFYHGMNRHLYDTHLDGNATSGRRRVPLLLDIFAFVIEGGILVAMGRALENPQSFLRLWTTLLLVDIVWSLLIWKIQESEWPRWVGNNAAWVAVAWVVWSAFPVLASHFDGDGSAVARIGSLALIEIGRSVTDYKANWQFYFPSTVTVMPVSDDDEQSARGAEGSVPRQSEES